MCLGVSHGEIIDDPYFLETLALWHDCGMALRRCATQRTWICILRLKCLRRTSNKNSHAASILGRINPAGRCLKNALMIFDDWSEIP
jgi:hypothetical protein